MVAAARAHARWALSASERDISNEVTALRTLRLSATQTVGIARALYDAAGDASLAAMPELADALSHAGEAFAAHSSAVRGGGGAITPAIQRAGQRARSAGERLVELGDPAALVAAGSIVADLTRMVDQLARAEGSDDDARGWDELMAWRRDEQARSLREARGEP